MITTLCLIVVALFVAAACNKPEKVDENEFLYANKVESIHAKIENASQYRNVAIVKLMVYDRTTNETHGNVNVFTDHYVEIARGEWKSGGFTIELPKTLDPNHIRPLIGDIGGNHPTNIYFKQPTMTTSEENVKVADAYFVGIDKNGNVVATFSPLNMVENGNTKAIFVYVDSDVTISGYIKREGHAIPAHEGAPSWFEVTTNYSVEWEKGWNVLFLSRTHLATGFTMITTEQWASTFVSGLRWYGSEENLHMFQN